MKKRNAKTTRKSAEGKPRRIRPGEALGPFRFREIDGRFLLTNDAGEFLFLERNDFELMTSGGLSAEHPHFAHLKSMGILLENGRVPPKLTAKYLRRNSFLFQGPQLFIVVATLRCDRRCIYCHASARRGGGADLDMNHDTAIRVADTIFQAPGANMAIEFQGGEPLLNWNIVRFLIDHVIDKNRRACKSLVINIVSNFMALNDEVLEFIVKHRVGLCTSLDGPESLHNKHRGGGRRELVKKIEAVARRYRAEYGRYYPAALTTVTRHSLPYAIEIVNSFVELGMEAIHLRPINPIGFARPVLKDIGYTPAQFLDFYEEALDYIISLNKKGVVMIERTAWIFLMKILGNYDPNFLDLRSPCGAGIGQIAFNYNGDVYTCDEGRMLSMQGDESFRMGNVFEMDYAELVNTEIVKQICLASILDGIPGCCDCAYKPYCGVCPLLNYAEEGSLFAEIPCNSRHIIYQGILDMLFRKIQDDPTRDVFMTWLHRGINLV